MNYRFSFDKEYSETHFFMLSETEKYAVLATVLGRHNAIFYGYEPERLARAIKSLTDYYNIPCEQPSTDCSIQDFYGGGPYLDRGVVSLAHNGIVIMKDLEKFRATVREMAIVPMRNGNITLSRAGQSVTYPSKFNLVATISGIPSPKCQKSISHLTDMCSIKYCCDATEVRNRFTLGELKTLLVNGKKRHNNRTGIIDSELVLNENAIDDEYGINFTSECRLIAKDLLEKNISICVCVSKVARTIADLCGHNLVRCWDMNLAKKLYSSINNIGEDTNELYQNLW